MIEERGRVVAIEADGLWVETIQRSGCHGCAAKSGCGTGLLGEYWASASRVRVALNGHAPESISLHDRVVIGIAENTLAGSALVVYIAPLLALVMSAILGEFWLGEPGAIAGAVLGLLGGAWFVRSYGRRNAANPAMVPQLLRIESDAACAAVTISL